MNDVFSLETNIFIRDIDIITNKWLENCNQNNTLTLQDLNKITKSITEKIDITLPTTDESYFCYIENDEDKSTKFLDTQLPMSTINIAPIKANFNVLKNYAIYINNSFNIPNTYKQNSEIIEDNDNYTINEGYISDEISELNNQNSYSYSTKISNAKDDLNYKIDSNTNMFGNTNKYIPKSMNTNEMYNNPTLKAANQLIDRLNTTDALETIQKDEKSAKREKTKLLNKNILTKFYGMRRQEITPEIRLELEAINIRAFINPKQKYRGAKRNFDLAQQKSGYFEIGKVINEHISDNFKSGTLKKKSRSKQKSLVKSLIINKLN